MITRLPAPSAKYDAQNEAAHRRLVEQALSQLSASRPEVTGPSVGGAGTSGKIPLWGVGGSVLGDSSMSEAGGVVDFGARPTVGAESMAFVSQLFTQLQADARYLGIVATAAAATKLATPRTIAGVSFDGTANIAIPFASIASKPATIAGYGITDGVTLDRLGASGAGGVLDWNDATNARPGTGFTLLLGTAANGPGPSGYFHTFGLEYASKNGTGNITQLAIPYGDQVNRGMFIRGRYAGAWTVWSRLALWTDMTWANFLGKPTTIAGYGITDFNSLGDARWLKLSGGTLTGALAGTTAVFSGDVNASDFVLEGTGGIPGPGGGSPVAVYDETTQLTPEVSVLRFVGPGVVASNSGSDVTVTFSDLFTQAMADSRYSLLGHTHAFSSLTSIPSTIGGYGITDFNSLGDARWVKKAGDTMTGALNGTSATFSGGVGADSYAVGGVNFAYYSSSYNMLYRRDGVIGIFLGGADPVNYYDNSAHMFRDRSGTVNAQIDSAGVTLKSTGNFYATAQYGQGLVGAYDPTRYRMVYAMGDAYRMSLDGTTLSNMYGLLYGFDSAGAGYKNITGLTLGHGFGMAAGGIVKTFFGENGSWIANSLHVLGSTFAIEAANDGVSPRIQSYNSRTLFINELGNPVVVGAYVTAIGFIGSDTYGWMIGNQSGYNRIYYAPASSRFEFVNSSNGFTGVKAFNYQFASGVYFQDFDANGFTIKNGGTVIAARLYSGSTQIGFPIYGDATGFGWLHSGGSWLLKNPYGTLDLVAGNNVTAHDFILA